MSKGRAARRHPGRHRPHRGVYIGYCRPDQVDGAFCDKLAGMCVWDGSNNGYIGGVISVRSGPMVHIARNDIVRMALGEERMEWLLFLDADMTFRQTLLDELVDTVVANPNVKVLGGLCFGGSEAKMWPTIYVVATKDGVVEAVHQSNMYPRDELIQVHGTGAACMMIHRTVLEDVEREFGPRSKEPWFAWTSFNDQHVGEDINFCLRAGIVGHEIWVNTAIKLGHRKMTELDETKWDLIPEHQKRVDA